MPAAISTAILSLFTSFAAPTDARAEGLDDPKIHALNAYRAKHAAINHAEARSDRAERALRAKRAERPERATRAKAERRDRVDRADRTDRTDRKDRKDRKAKTWKFCDALACTDAQVAEIRGIRAAFKSDTADLRASKKQLKEAIRDESRSESPDESAIRGMKEKLAALKVSLHEAHADKHAAVLAVLTDAQRERFEAMKAAKAERKAERKADRKSDRKTERRADRKTERRADRKADRRSERRADRNSERLARR